MKKIEEIRNNLYKALDIGERKEIISLSRKLDKIIVSLLKEERLEKNRQNPKLESK